MSPNETIEWTPGQLADVPSWALELELHLRRGPVRFCHECESWVDGPADSLDHACPECREYGCIADKNDTLDPTSPAYLAWRARTVARYMPLPTCIDKLCALLKEAGAVVKIGLEQQGHIETVRQMLDDGKSWDAINAAIGWNGNAAREEWEAMGYGWRMDAYYYSFDRTGVPAVDLVLSAVACAGKHGSHHTDGWTDEVNAGWRGDHLEGSTPRDWIQNAANKAADAFRELLKPRPRR
jgi:hypothetical protein